MQLEVFFVSNKRNYTFIKIHKQQIIKMHEEGKSFRQISQALGFKNKYVVKEFFERLRKKNIISFLKLIYLRKRVEKIQSQ